MKSEEQLAQLQLQNEHLKLQAQIDKRLKEEEERYQREFVELTAHGAGLNSDAISANLRQQVFKNKIIIILLVDLSELFLRYCTSTPRNLSQPAEHMKTLFPGWLDYCYVFFSFSLSHTNKPINALAHLMNAFFFFSFPFF